MATAHDLTGEKFGRWIAIKRAGAEFAWHCRCDCGKRGKVLTQSLINGRSKSCGCLQRELAAETTRIAKTTHGESSAPEYRVWAAMVSRCTNPGVRNWADYGGRGIQVCDRWREYANFIADMGHRPEDGMLERGDNDRNYEPGNCRWATRTEQNRNTRRNRFLTHESQTKCITEWTALRGFKENTIRQRLFMGWEVSRAIETPIRPQKPRKRK